MFDIVVKPIIKKWRTVRSVFDPNQEINAYDKDRYRISSFDPTQDKTKDILSRPL